MNLSVAITTFNNTRTIRQVLEAVAGWANEIVVLDSGSTDGTLEIAKEFGCQIYYRKFEGYGAQKHHAATHARNDWVLVVDSDEVVTKELRDEIDASLATNTEYRGYMVPSTIVFLGKILHYGREYKMPRLRLFNKKYGNFNLKDIHEEVELDGKVKTLENHVLHYSYADVTDCFQKVNSYSSRMALQLHEKGKRASVLKIVTKFPITFFVEYFIRLNFLNGYRGFVWAFAQTVYATLKYIKMRELQQKN
ncbi:glycosyltransferase family 2 protein [Emticicia sp. BO119]|uniref:glycosyltransferase family 2 protein n=1 Tax=Emticicia sp. BO119 TaxID=2757768 RepID=UPI0015F0B36B|nr:glycosyltransferase family 2 protein [Emticicia sp. BO119]MBA4854037.1 glycosyltransferase family 2 protein [Emticicia sp. BO119]